MNDRPERIGAFTSSEIVALTKGGRRDMTEEEMEAYKIAEPKGKRKTIDVMFGEAAMTYISETNFERKLLRSISTESNAKPTSYGKLVEMFAFKQLGLEYQMAADKTVVHPKIPFWSGSGDCFKYDEGKTCVDLKCPYTLLSYCRFAECKTIEQVREKHPDGDKYFFQVLSNAIINDCKYGELIFFCPYKSQLTAIRDLAQEYPDPNKVAFIHFATDEDLPYLPDSGYYKNFHTVRWEISAEDKLDLTHRVLEAGKLLVDRYEPEQKAAEKITPNPQA